MVESDAIVLLDVTNLSLLIVTKEEKDHSYIPFADNAGSAVYHRSWEITLR